MGWGQPHVGNGAVEPQHGTGVEGSLHPCTKCHHPEKGFLHLEAHTLIATFLLRSSQPSSDLALAETENFPMSNCHTMYDIVLCYIDFLLSGLKINLVRDL
jgi:hypothetical protein